MKKLFAVQLWLLLLVIDGAHAETVRDLYAAQVPVQDQSAEALSSASRLALAEVMVKVSGRQDVLKNAQVASALRNARKHVLQYAYARDKNDRRALEARFEFDNAWVVEVLTAAGEPLWTANRPLVLVWLVAEDTEGRYFVNQDRSPELADRVLREFERRGVPARLPLFDLVDSKALSADQAWRLRAGDLNAASARYDVENFIAGRMAALSSGGATGEWSYFYDGDRSDRSITGSDQQEFIAGGVAMVAESMAGRYAVAPTLDVTDGVIVSVQGVQRYGDYANVVAWLEDLELVEHANLERVTGDMIEIRVSASADATQLATLIALNQRLLPVPPIAPHIQLSYQWQN